LCIGIPFPIEIQIESEVSRDSVIEFVEACQHRPFFVSRSNAHDLVCLCSEWETLTLKYRIFDWISSHESELLIEMLLFDLRQRHDTSFVESWIRDNFSSFVSDENLLNIPLNILRRLISGDLSLIFDF
jgi:hypothetical protein